MVPGRLFKESDFVKIESFLQTKVIILIKNVSITSATLFGSCLICEIKGLPAMPYKKFRLVV